MTRILAMAVSKQTPRAPSQRGVTRRESFHIGLTVDPNPSRTLSGRKSRHLQIITVVLSRFPHSAQSCEGSVVFEENANGPSGRLLELPRRKQEQ